ncbi:mechanosensitive ion channel family protein [Ochrobactrum soli]|uniref:Mechanosensitive ion channel n=1 Tax=Ochrobactrum soli TaxID=2448455 RepID=A0A2P9HEY0_9HYPH|nr:mechanosensitive ion channel family protein [[Ochrobactrum] soli]SPL62658.1 Mechanosensitive ion channel [[Ochrobactrum] soli]
MYETSFPYLVTVKEIWRYEVAGVTIGQILLAVLMVAIAAAVRRLFGSVVLRQLRHRTRKTTGKMEDAIIEALAPPLRFIPILVAFFSIAGFLTVPPEITELFRRINRSLVVITLFWVLFEAVSPLFTGLAGRLPNFSHGMIGWAIRVGRIVILFLGTAITLGIWDIHVGPVLAGLGLVGAAVALGAQDLFKNLIAGFFIIGEQRFESGDWIVVDSVVEGTVELIGLRTTKIRRFDMAPVYVPNSKLADNALTNFSKMSYRRISWVIGLEYETSIDQLKTIRDGIAEYISRTPGFVDPPAVPTFVRIANFGDSSIDMMVYCFTHTTNWGEYLEIKEALAYEVKTLIAAAGSDFAFPSRSLYVETLPSGAEIFPAGHSPIEMGKEPARAS